MTERKTGSTMLRRQIGRKFEQLRKASGHTIDRAADKLERARITIYRIEKGEDTVRFRNADVNQMCQLYQASTEDTELLLALTAETREVKNWWHDYDGSAIPKYFSLYVGLEDSAAKMRQYEVELVPGLFQTRGYARAIFDTPGGASDETELTRRIEVRVVRQQVLTRFNPPDLHVVLNEAVLCRPIGGPEVMAEQLRYILKATELSNITVQVIPFAAGLHAALSSGAFHLFDFPPAKRGEPNEPPVLYMEAIGGATYLDKPHLIDSHNEVWSALVGQSLDEGDSRDLIEQHAKEYSGA